MPIYAYKCGSCGHAKDVLQKMSDSPLSVCPACGAESFTKQLTAAGFQLKGSGWYVTDFRGGSSGTAAPATADKNSTPAAATDTPTSGATTADAPKTVAASATPAPASAGSADKT